MMQDGREQFPTKFIAKEPNRLGISIRKNGILWNSREPSIRQKFWRVDSDDLKFSTVGWHFQAVMLASPAVIFNRLGEWHRSSFKGSYVWTMLDIICDQCGWFGILGCYPPKVRWEMTLLLSFVILWMKPTCESMLLSYMT